MLDFSRWKATVMKTPLFGSWAYRKWSLRFVVLLFIIVNLCLLLVFRKEPEQPISVDPNLLEKINQGRLQSPVKVAVINRHEGCRKDLTYLSDLMGFSFIEFDYKELFKHTEGTRQVKEWLLEEEANDPHFQTIAQSICDVYDIVFVMDVNPDARFLLQYIDRVGVQCKLDKVIMITTNRVDYHVHEEPDITNYHQDLASYHHLLARVTQKQLGPRITWVANNPWEAPYAKHWLRGDYLNYTMIRPFGVTSVDNDRILSAQEQYTFVTLKDGFNEGFYDILKHNKIAVEPITRHYGGPKVLRQYAGYIELPYQVSTMKMYENLAHGVLMIIPTPRFYKELFALSGPPGSRTIKGVWLWGLTLCDFDPEHIASNWIDYMEYYHEDFKDLFVQFDSFEELRNITSQPIPQSADKRMKQIKRFRALRNKSLLDWAQVLNMNPKKFNI